MKNNMKKVLVDYDIQQFIGKQLRFGVVLSCCIAVLGGVYYLLVHGAEPMPAYNHFVSEPSSFTTLQGIFSGVVAGNAYDIIQLGVVVLLATPILRVFFSLIAFAIEKDHMYVVITAIVLGVILFSMISGVKI